MTQGIPSTWADARLEEIAEIHDHLREPVNSTERASRQGPYPYYGATGQVGWIDGYRQDGEYVLLGEDGAPFLDPSKSKAYMVSGKCWVNNHAHVLKGVEGICTNKYLLHALNVVNYRGYANGTTRLKLTQEAMRRLPVRIAPAKEQHRIVEKIDELLSDLDAGVAALERARANLKRYRAAVLKAAVEGKLTEQWRKAHSNVEPASKLLERILAERRKRWEEAQLAKFAAAGKAPPKGWKEKYPEPAKPQIADLSELPVGWCWATTDQLFWYVTSGSRGWAAYYSDEGPLFLRIANLDHFRIGLDLSKLQHVTPPAGAEGERTRVFLYDLLISITADVGMVGYVEQDIGEAYINQHIALARGTLPEVMEYAAWYLTSESGQVQFKGLQRGATKVGLGLDDIRSVHVPLPPLNEQIEIVRQLDTAYSAADKSHDACLQIFEHSNCLRQSILKHAFEGKLVSQDPSDEPASVLLERIRAACREQQTRKGRSGHARYKK